MQNNSPSRFQCMNINQLISCEKKIPAFQMVTVTDLDTRNILNSERFALR